MPEANKAEFSLEVLAEFPDDMTFPYSDPEVYGIYRPVRKRSMRVPDIQEGPESNDLTPSHKNIQISLYAERCEFRRKEKIARLRKLLAQRLDKGSASILLCSCYAGTRTVVGTEPEDDNVDEGVAAQSSPEETLAPRGELHGSLNVFRQLVRNGNRQSYSPCRCALHFRSPNTGIEFLILKMDH